MKRSAFACALAGSFAGPYLARAQSQGTAIRLGTSPTESYSLAHFALQKGFFKDAGLDVEIVSVIGGGAIMAAAAGGAMDVACANVGIQSSAHIRGLPFSMISGGADYTTQSPSTVMVVVKASPLRSARDLTGKTIGVSTLRDLQQAAVMKWFDSNGADSSALRFIETTTSSLLPALLSGRIDAACLDDTAYALAKNDVRVVAKPYDTLAKRLTITTHFANNEWLVKAPQAAKAFVGAIGRAAIWCDNNRAETGAMLSKLAKIEPNAFMSGNHVIYSDRLNASTIQPTIDAMAYYKFLPNSFKASEMFWI